MGIDHPAILSLSSQVFLKHCNAVSFVPFSGESTRSQIFRVSQSEESSRPGGEKGSSSQRILLGLNKKGVYDMNTTSLKTIQYTIITTKYPRLGDEGGREGGERVKGNQ